MKDTGQVTFRCMFSEQDMTLIYRTQVYLLCVRNAMYSVSRSILNCSLSITEALALNHSQSLIAGMDCEQTVV